MSAPETRTPETTNRKLVLIFAAFHATLGLVILVQSVETALHALSAHGAQPLQVGLALFAGAEALAAALFLVPATTRLGAVALIVIFAVALGLHGLQGEFELTLLVYAAGVALVMVHGSVFGRLLQPSRSAV